MKNGSVSFPILIASGLGGLHLEKLRTMILTVNDHRCGFGSPQWDSLNMENRRGRVVVNVGHVLSFFRFGHLLKTAGSTKVTQPRLRIARSCPLPCVLATMSSHHLLSVYEHVMKYSTLPFPGN